MKFEGLWKFLKSPWISISKYSGYPGKTPNRWPVGDRVLPYSPPHINNTTFNSVTTVAYFSLFACLSWCIHELSRYRHEMQFTAKYHPLWMLPLCHHALPLPAMLVSSNVVSPKCPRHATHMSYPCCPNICVQMVCHPNNLTVQNVWPRTVSLRNSALN